LAHTRSATDPVTCCECVHNLGSQDVRSQAGGDFQLSLAVVVTLELVLEVTSKLSRGHTEQIFDEVTSEANTLVCVVVLVVWLTVGEGHFKDLADNSAKEDSLLLSSARLVAQVRKEFTIEQLVDSLLSVFTLLTGCEFLLQPFVSFGHGLNRVLFVVVDFVEVCNDVLERLSWSSNSLEHFLVVLDTKCTHEENHGDSGCSSGADLDHEHTVTSLLNVEWLAHTVFLGENLSNFGSLCVSLVDFNSDTVW